MLPTVSVVVPTYGRDRVLTDTIDALLMLRIRPAEIILADQTTRHDDDTQCQLESWTNSEEIKWLLLPHPSIPHAMNRGLLAARSELVLFIDDDITPDGELVQVHARAHSDFPGEIVAGRVLQPWHNGQSDSAEKPFDFSSPAQRVVNEFMGGNFSVCRNDALALGGFDENFVRVAYRFEAEFANRWCASGRRIRYEPLALVHHLKVSQGGTRSFGEHFRTIGPAHTVGAHYFLITTKGIKSVPDIMLRILGSVKTRYHLKKPWWIPLTLISEISGVLWAVILKIRGPRCLPTQ